jgi:predicted RNA binding protein YcfA (HicA-like mRNA interferase family)
LSYFRAVKGRELIRKLRQAGVEVIKSRGKGGHYVLRYGGRQTSVPFHGARDLGPNLISDICKQLGIDPERTS